MGLWSAAKNQKAATRVAAQQEGITGVSVLDEEGKRQLPNDESGDLSDIYEYKKQVSIISVAFGGFVFVGRSQERDARL